MELKELRFKFQQITGGDPQAIKSLNAELIAAQRLYGVGSWGRARCTMDAGRLFDSLALAELHLLTAVKHLPAQCLSEDVVANVIPVKGE